MLICLKMSDYRHFYLNIFYKAIERKLKNKTVFLVKLGGKRECQTMKIGEKIHIRY